MNEEWILLNLNSENCFDFEYSPIEGDNLKFLSDRNFDYLSFIFKSRSWEIEHYSPFNTIFQKIDEGKIEAMKAIPV